MSIENNIQSAAERLLSSHLAAGPAKEVATAIAQDVAASVRDGLIAYLSNGHANGHTNGHTNGHAAAAKKGGRPRKAVAAAPAAGTAVASDPAKEVMRLKKRLFWALKRQGTEDAQEDDGDLIARKEEIEKLSTQDFIQRGLTADSFLKKAKRKAAAQAAAPKAAKGKKAAPKAARKKAPEGLDAVL